ncbi:MAG: LysR family transcriptional regulator, partial [Paracoccaceae bacterium]
MSLAAASLNITQPAVSKTIKELEELLQTPLFDRVGRRLQLNEQGRIFQNHAAASWLELSKAKDRLS